MISLIIVLILLDDTPSPSCPVIPLEKKYLISKSSFKSKKEQAEYARQLYLYALHVKKKYGKYPELLQFSMFRKNVVIEIPFDEKSLNEAVRWAKETVKEIRECWDFAPNCDEFFSENLCNHREYCDCKREKPPSTAKWKRAKK